MTPAAASCSRRSAGFPEYYPTRTEMAVMRTHAHEMAGDWAAIA